MDLAMLPADHDPRDFRYERKFHETWLDRHRIEALVKLHPAGFTEAYPPRFVNNIYLDSPGLQNYVAHVNGHGKRAKIRIRWYGDLTGPVARPVLEVKGKIGYVGYKHHFPLNGLDLDQPLDSETLAAGLEARSVPETLRCQVACYAPKVGNRYRRQYYVSGDGVVRVTLDFDLTFYHLAAGSYALTQRTAHKAGTVIELKYARDDQAKAVAIASGFPFRLYKLSKYVDGVEALQARYGPL